MCGGKDTVRTIVEQSFDETSDGARMMSMTKRINAAQQASTAAKINTLRATARGITVEALRALPCPTCCRGAHDPYRRHDGRSYTEGCVDAHHHGLTGPGATAEWHSNGASIRRAELAHLVSL